uniref:RNA polymerase II-associated factor 1 homolog n=1 Tax=Angiostrongylus cantonensis TaxID=6313 RepID=A0A0K0DB48_ANGCA
MVLLRFNINCFIYEYVLNREYTWTVKNKNTKGFERDNFFVYYKDGWFHYNELETKVRLVRRRRPVHEKDGSSDNEKADESDDEVTEVEHNTGGGEKESTDESD